jgi:hypothetical protein
MLFDNKLSTSDSSECQAPEEITLAPCRGSLSSKDKTIDQTPKFVPTEYTSRKQTSSAKRRKRRNKAKLPKIAPRSLECLNRAPIEISQPEVKQTDDTKVHVFPQDDTLNKCFSCNKKTHGRNMYCSMDCKLSDVRSSIEKYLDECHYCGKKFHSIKGKIFCSQNCMTSHRLTKRIEENDFELIAIRSDYDELYDDACECLWYSCDDARERLKRFDNEWKQLNRVNERLRNQLENIRK